MANANVDPFLDGSFVSPEVEEAVRAAQPGGMKPNTRFAMVHEKKGS